MAKSLSSRSRTDSVTLLTQTQRWYPGVPCQQFSHTVYRINVSNYAKDDYLTALWQGDGRAYVGPLIERAHGGDVEYDISVITPTQITKDLTVSLERALTQDVSLRVRIIGSEKVTALNKRSLAKGVYSLAQELRVDGVQVFNIQYRVKNSNGAIEYGYSIGGSTRMSLDELIKNAKEDDIKS